MTQLDPTNPDPSKVDPIREAVTEANSSSAPLGDTAASAGLTPAPAEVGAGADPGTSDAPINMASGAAPPPPPAAAAPAQVNAPGVGGIVWPFGTKSQTQFHRVDQGWDIQSNPGAPIYAVAAGTISVANADPGGFGNNYPTQALDASIGGPSNQVYYGHAHVDPAVVGKHVAAGTLIGYTNKSDGENGSAAPPGWLEIGFASPGTGSPLVKGEANNSAGEAMRNLLVGGQAAPGAGGSVPIAPTPAPDPAPRPKAHQVVAPLSPQGALVLPTTAPAAPQPGVPFDPAHPDHQVAAMIGILKGDNYIAQATGTAATDAADRTASEQPGITAPAPVAGGVGAAPGTSDAPINTASGPAPPPPPPAAAAAAPGAAAAGGSGNWVKDILAGVGAPDTPENERALHAWQRAEGGGTGGPSGSNFNWFNTTQDAPGATSVNKVGVKSYADYNSGIWATVQTMMNGQYGSLIGALRSGNDAMAVANAVIGSKWGTGPLMRTILEQG